MEIKFTTDERQEIEPTWDATVGYELKKPQSSGEIAGSIDIDRISISKPESGGLAGTVDAEFPGEFPGRPDRETLAGSGAPVDSYIELRTGGTTQVDKYTTLSNLTSGQSLTAGKALSATSLNLRFDDGDGILEKDEREKPQVFTKS